ncbi:MAG: M949_RS01915 family surface polysaccharide biosynthesis protein [Mucilaginibacter sp.]
MKLISILILLLAMQFASAQVKVMHLNGKDIPKNMPYQGGLKDAIQYTDKEGTHVVIMTEDITDDKDDGDMRKASIYAFSYLKNGNSATLQWKMYDFTDLCNVDLEATYKDNAYVTDLDKNGVAEVWLTYIEACKGDASPSAMKIIMHEGAKKFAMRGTTRVNTGNNVYMGGSYTFDEAFKAAPQSFRNYALQLWKKNVKEDHFY